MSNVSSSRVSEVLIRMQDVFIPPQLAIEIFDRDNESLKKQREQGQVLPGKKVFQTNSKIHKGWHLTGLMPSLANQGLLTAQVNVEVRDNPSGGVCGTKQVLSIGYNQGPEHRCDPAVLDWIIGVVMKKVYKYGMIHLNPLVSGGSQLVIDLSGPTYHKSGQAQLPLERYLDSDSVPEQFVPGQTSGTETSMA